MVENYQKMEVLCPGKKTKPQTKNR